MCGGVCIWNDARMEELLNELIHIEKWMMDRTVSRVLLLCMRPASMASTWEFKEGRRYQGGLD